VPQDGGYWEKEEQKEKEIMRGKGKRGEKYLNLNKIKKKKVKFFF
jgi:hypothetical protein